MIDKRLERYFEDACLILDNLGITYGPIRNVTVNTRAKARWGRCKRTTIYDWYECYDIEISSLLLQSDVDYKAVMDTMLHELLHCHKDRFSHTGEWKTCANLVNINYGYTIKRTTTPEEKNIKSDRISTPRYIITCNNCGTVNRYIRANKVVKALLRNSEGTCTCDVCNGQSFTIDKI